MLPNEYPDSPQLEPTYTKGPFTGLTPSVIKLGWVSFFADVSSEMLYPLLPIFLTVVIGAPVAAVGIIEGVAEATASLLKSLSGWWSDKIGRRKPFVFFGYLISALAKPMLALASGWSFVLVARVSDRFGKGLRGSARDALLADSVSKEARGKAFGWHRAMDTCGAIIGPLLALTLVAATKENLRWVFLLAFIPGLIGALIVFFVTERRRAPQPAISLLGFKEMPKPFKHYLFIWGIFAITNSSDAFLILRAKELGNSLTIIILLYVAYNIIYAAASPYLGGLSDRIGRRAVLVGGLTVFAVVYAGFAIANQNWQLWVLFIVYGLYTAATDGVGKSFAVDLVPTSIRASAVGLLGTVTGLATLVASSVAGVLWTGIGSWAAFVLGVGGAVLTAGLLVIARLNREERVA